MKLPNSLFLTILIGISVLSAQETGTVSGTVVDNHTQEALAGVNVVVLGTERGAVTDSKGRYTVEAIPVGTYRIRFSYIGYESAVKTDVVVKSANPVFINAQLEPSVLESDAVTVKAGYFTTEAEVQPSTTVLSREEIRRFPGGFEDVVRTVSTLPGVAINMEGGRNDILVRGGGPSENLYLINNIEVPNINHFGTPGNTGGSLSFVNLDFVEDVTFSTGGFGARYGDKMSSVIELTMVKRRPEQIETKATIAATQYGLTFETPLKDNGSLILSARKSYLDLIFKAAGLPFVPIYTDYNVLLNYEFSPTDKLFIIGLSAIDNVDRNQSSLENRVFNAGILDNTQYKGITGVNYRHILAKGYLDFTASVGLSRFRLSQIDENEKPYFRNHADEWEYAAKFQAFFTLGKTLFLSSGVSAKAVRNDNLTVFADTIIDRSGNRVPLASLGIASETRSDYFVSKGAGFAELEWDPHPRVQLTGGLRTEYYDFIIQHFYTAPRFGIQYRAAEKHTLRLSGGEYFQSPSYTWVANPANRKLRALRNRMAVLGWDWLPREDTKISIEGYVKRYSDLPGGNRRGVTDYVVMTNTGTSFGGREDDFQSFGYFELESNGRGKSTGLEFSAQKKFSDTPLYGLFSLGYNRSELTAANGRTYPSQYDQRWIVNLSGGYIFNEKWEVSAKFKYYTGVPYTPVYRPSANPSHPGIIQNLPDEYLSARLDPGHQLDVRVDRTFNFPRITLIVYADIQNVYNFKYPMKPQYDFWNDKVQTRGDIGILPSIGISLEF